MKSALSADQLSAVWLQIGSTYGKLDQWKIIEHGMLAETDVFGVVLAFEHGKLIATVSIRPQTGEIAEQIEELSDVFGKGLERLNGRAK